jgi:DNA-binding transcriptional LysR family regulator
MELRHLRYFLAVAKERHFTRAAERLGIKQPPLSMQIRQLEQEVGTPLFHRLTRGVELTEAGEALFEQVERLLQQLDQVKADVQSRARGETGHIRIGFAGATYFNPLVPAIAMAFRERFPNVALTPEESNTPRLAAGLRGGEIDVAFVRPPVSAADDLRVDPLSQEPMVAVLPQSHPLAGESSVALDALAEEQLILFPRVIGPGLYDSIIAGFQGAGLSPKIGQEAPQIPSTVHLVAAGFGVSIVPRSIEQIRAQGIRYLPIEGEPLIAPIGLAYRKDERSKVVRNFVSVARARASEAPPPE